MTRPPDEDLPPALQDALLALPRESPPPPALEDLTVSALTRRGLLGARGKGRLPHRWLLQSAVAALLVAAGWLGGRRSAPPAIPASTTPRFVLLLYGGEVPDSAGPAAHAARVQEYAAWAQARHATGSVVGGEELADTAITLGSAPRAMPEAGETGPGGFFIVEAPDLPSAIQLARTCPHLSHGGTVVVRPIPAANGAG
ncbi:MAG TPA: hypothetical protein VH879_16470 [Gemmatimonadales bacterium]